MQKRVNAMGWLNHIFRSAAVFLFIFLVAVIHSAAQSSAAGYAVEARLLKRTLLEKHIYPRKIDNSFSAWVFDNTMDELDPDRLIFTREDVSSLLTYREKIDEELNGAGWYFLPQLTQLYKRCLQRYRAGINDVGTQPVDFFSPAFIRNDSAWAGNVDALRKKWSLAFRHQLQNKLSEVAERGGAKADKDFLVKNQGAARQQVVRVMLREADRILEHSSGFESFVASVFMESMAAGFDPHTGYMTATQMRNFIASLSTQGYLFGFTLDENESGEVVVSQLMPGGPAWNSGEMHKGDALQSVRWEGKDEEDLSGIDMEEVNEILEDPDKAKIELTIKRSDGTVSTVALRKEKVTAEQNVVRSFVLGGERKIGFISLPDFYTDWDDSDGSKCASDVAREIVKLKRENIEGLILDVRYNGGGSMAEAVAMAGIFIDAGPVGVTKNQAGELTTVKDINRGTIYDGPLVIMVNCLSASASEFLAAALQDYNRALIVGSRTYGKATAQTLVPADPALKMDDNKFMQQISAMSSGFAKVTIEQLYRITGKTAQQKGVIPDIELPDALNLLPMREGNLPRAFPSDSIQKKVYYQPLVPLPRKELLKKSKLRTDQQSQFLSLSKLGPLVADYSVGSDSLALSWPDFRKAAEMHTQLVKEVATGMIATDKSFQARLLKEDESRASPDPYYVEFNKNWIKNLEGDIFLNEAFLITCDLISHVTKK